MKYFKSITKKLSWFLFFNLVVALFVMLTHRGIDAMFFDALPAVLVLFVMLPFISGVLLILLQNKNRSYEFLPVLLISSCLNNAAIALVFALREYFRHNYIYRFPPNLYDSMGLFLYLVAISIFGGLIGLVIRGTSEQLKKYSNSIIVIALRKILGSIFLSFSILGGLVSLTVFFTLIFNPSSSWLNIIMVDFRLAEVIGIVFYYLLFLSALSILLISLTFLANLGWKLLFFEKKFISKKNALRLVVYFFLSLVVFLLLSIYTGSEFEVKKAEMKADIRESHVDISGFKNIYISRFVKFEDIIIKQGENFDIAVKGSEYDRIGLDFEKTDNTLNIKRSELETYYNTNTWTMENRDNVLFHASTKHITIEITMPDLEKIENAGANVMLEDLEVDNIEIKLNERFNNVKGNIKVASTLKLDARGGIINLTGSAENLEINSGDCWIEMDKFPVENATINAVNTSRLNLYVTGNMEVRSGKNSGIINYFDELNKNLTENDFGNNQIEEAVSKYLLTERHFSWKNRDDSHNFCAVQNLKPSKELFPLYFWAYCGEYIIENGKLKTVSGFSGPVKINYPNELSYYDISKFSYEAPGDGSNYLKDIKVIFPEDVWQKIFDYDVNNLIARVENYAFTTISDWNLIKQAIANCEIESIMQTHSLEVTANFKDGKIITTKEPRIDDVFNIINQYKYRCGGIMMATE